MALNPRQFWRRRFEESGFTLIELLVVIIILGILAAIALPIFMDQRQRAYDARAKSALRNFAEFEETYLVNAGTYTDIAGLQSDGYQTIVDHGTTLWVEHFDTAIGYCLKAQTTGGRVWYYDPRAGGIQPTGAADCATSTTGPSGGSVSG